VRKISEILQNEKSEGQLLLHFFLADESHDIDALILHSCQGEIIRLIKEVSKTLGLDVGIEIRAYGEGGIETYLKFIGAHSQALALIGAAITAICSGVTWWSYQSALLQQQIDQNNFTIQREKRLAEQQIEQNEINLRRARIELRKLEQEEHTSIEKAPSTSSTQSLPLQSAPVLADIVPGLLSNSRILKIRSQFYDHLIAYEKVTAVGFAPKHKPIENEQKIVPRARFSDYTIGHIEIEPKIVPAAEIEIVAPILIRSHTKWRGIYEKRSISFEISDNSFISQVTSKAVTFQSGSTLICEMEVHFKETDAGEIIPHEYIVKHVIKHYNKIHAHIQKSKVSKSATQSAVKTENQRQLQLKLSS
jgi:hypothetical protein